MSDTDASAIEQEVFAALRASVGDDDEFVVDLVETYLTDTSTQLDAIDRAVTANDAELLVRPAHTLKTGSLTIGATRLGELSRSLEETARSAMLEPAPAQAAAIHEEWSRVERALRDWVSGRSGS
jgi:HPt (histidine-containing phosphotransfer) domain-containing protein